MPNQNDRTQKPNQQNPQQPKKPAAPGSREQGTNTNRDQENSA